MFSKFCKKYLLSTITAEILICFFPLCYYAAIVNELPEIIPIHFNIEGEPDGFASSKGWEMLMLILMPIFILILSFIIQWIIFRKQHNHSGKKALAKIMIIAELLLSFLCLCVLKIAQGYPLFEWVSVTRFVSAVISLLWIISGNYIPKLPRNKLAGIRTKYSLSSDDAWTKSQRYGGKVFVISGFAGLLISVLPIIPNTIVFILTLSILILYPSFSLIFWKPEKS